MLAVAACTSRNPAYETSAASESETSSTGADEGRTTDVEQSGSTETSVLDTTTDGSGASTGDVIGLDEHCRSELYGITELGTLLLIDVDVPEVLEATSDPRLRSWAGATDPSGGTIYISEHVNPGVVWRVEPQGFTIADEPLVVAAEMLAPMARATFDHHGNLWLGTDETHHFVWMLPSGTIVGEHTTPSFPRGGDMVFLDDGCAAVPTLASTFHRVCIPDGGMEPLPILVEGIPTGLQFTGAAVDGSGRMWLSSVVGDPEQLGPLVRIDRTARPWQVEQVLELPEGTPLITDLASVVPLPGC